MENDTDILIDFIVELGLHLIEFPDEFVSSDVLEFLHHLVETELSYRAEVVIH